MTKHISMTKMLTPQQEKTMKKAALPAAQELGADRPAPAVLLRRSVLSMMGSQRRMKSCGMMIFLPSLPELSPPDCAAESPAEMPRLF